MSKDVSVEGLMTEHLPFCLYDLLQSLYQTYLNEPELADQICEGLPVKAKDQKAKIAAWTILVNSLYNLDITKTRD